MASCSGAVLARLGRRQVHVSVNTVQTSSASRPRNTARAAAAGAAAADVRPLATAARRSAPRARRTRLRAGAPGMDASGQTLVVEIAERERGWDKQIASCDVASSKSASVALHVIDTRVDPSRLELKCIP
jgi:hypothetical protein